MGSTLRSRLDLLRSDIARQVEDKQSYQKERHDVHASMRSFSEGEVYEEFWSTNTKEVVIRIHCNSHGTIVIRWSYRMELSVIGIKTTSISVMTQRAIAGHRCRIYPRCLNTSSGAVKSDCKTRILTIPNCSYWTYRT